MPTAPSPLHFYFDFISPFGYFASLRIEALAAKHGRTVQWHAMLLGVSVLKVMGLKPLLDTPLKGDYIRRDAKRYMRRHGLHLQRDLDAPMMDPRAAGRAFHWVKHHRPEMAAPLAHAIYRAYWAEGQDLSKAESVAAMALPAGIDSTWLLEGIQSDEAGQLLRSAVDTSLKLGIFGSPRWWWTVSLFGVWRRLICWTSGLLKVAGSLLARPVVPTYVPANTNSIFTAIAASRARSALSNAAS